MSINYGAVDYNDFARKEKIKKQDKSVSCVYELLNEGQSCKWQNDGTIVLNRPASSSLLNKIKFRSFSANIRNDITNTSIPDLSFDLCARFIHLNTSDAVYRKLRETPSEQTKLYIGNSSGEYVFEGGNGIYDNDVNGNIVIETDKINIANGLDEAYKSAANYSNKQIKSLLGFHLKEESDDYYQYNSFSTSLQTKYKYLNGCNGLCIGFNETTQNPIWLNTTTFEEEERTYKDYYNLLGCPFVSRLSDETGDKANNNYVVGGCYDINGYGYVFSSGIENTVMIDIVGTSNYSLEKWFCSLWCDATDFSSFEDRKKYKKTAKYYFTTKRVSRTKTFDITTQIASLIERNNLSGDIYINLGGCFKYKDDNNVGWFCGCLYVIGDKPTTKLLTFKYSTNSDNLFTNILNADDYYITAPLTHYPYYGGDYWWLFLSQHFCGFYNNKTIWDSYFMIICGLPYKDILGGNYYCFPVYSVAINDYISDTQIINNYTTSPTPLLFMFSKELNKSYVYSCRYSKEGSNKLCYSWGAASNLTFPNTIQCFTNEDNIGSSYNVEYIEFGDENTLAFQYSDYVFDGSYYYKYQYWSPFYTLSDSKIYYSAGGVLFEPYTPIIVSKDGITWINSTHTGDYNYRLIYSEGLSDNYFTYNKDEQTINSIRIPVWNQSTKDYGIIEFYLRFYTNPISFFIDPTIKMLPYSMSDYYDCTSQENYINGVIVNEYNIPAITKIVDETYYNKVLLFMELSNSDQTLKLVCDNYPTLNNIVFYLNETSMIDFKEADSNPAEPNIKCKIVDANDVVITPKNAKNLYSNITICLDWEFNN